MARQQFKTLDVVRLEIENPGPGLVNLIDNPNGDLGGWGWLTPVTGTKVTGGATLTYAAVAGTANSFYSRPFPVAAGQYAAARWQQVSVGDGSNASYRVRLEWLNAAGAVIASSAQSSAFTGTIVSRAYSAVQAPANAVAARWRFDVYAPNGTSVPAAAVTIRWRQMTVAKAATAAALASLGYLEPVQWLNVTGEASQIKVTRDEFSAGLLEATILDADLDPSQASVIRPGRRVRVTALSGGSWSPLFTGKTRNATVTYDLKTAGIPEEKRARIELSAVDGVSQLAAVPRSEGVATINDLRYILEGVGIPWNVNGVGSHLGPAPTIVTRNANAKALDQVVITRDSVRGYAWVDRQGALQVWDAAAISTLRAATLDEGDYSDLDIDYDTERCINVVNIKYLRTNLATGQTVEVPYGPYSDQASVDTWGAREATFTIQGITETAANMQAYATAILAANATPRLRVNSVTVPLITTAHIAHAQCDLYDRVRVVNVNAGLSDDLRITGIEHSITAEKWTVKYSFATTGGAAPPQTTPTPPAPASAAQPGVWQEYNPTILAGSIGAGTKAGRYTRIGNTVHFQISATLGAGFNVNGGIKFSLPTGVSGTSSGGLTQALLGNAGNNTYSVVGYLDVSGVTFYATTSNGAFQLASATVPFAWKASDYITLIGTYEAAS